jgi:O-antigen/teichoic acid export membrane protein
MAQVSWHKVPDKAVTDKVVGGNWVSTMSQSLFRGTCGLWGSLLVNSAFLIANTLTGSFLGFLFWVVTAHRYTPTQVGIGSASLAAITFLSNLGEVGLGTALIRFVPSLEGKQASFVNSSLTVVAINTLVLTVIFLLGTSIWSPELSTLTQSNLHLGVFTGATVAFSLAQLLDRLYIAFQVTHFAFIRNLLSNALRIVFVMTLGRVLGAFGLVMAVGVGSAVTCCLSALVFAPRALPNYRIQPDFAWPLLLEKARYCLGNHLSLLLWNTSPLVYPLIIVSVLGAEANAHFYVSWMIANLLFVVPAAVATSAFAQAANNTDMSERVFWKTMRLTLIGLTPVVLGLTISSNILLGFFGQEYVAAGQSLFVLLLISAFPYTVNTFIIVDCRIRQNIRGVVLISGLMALLSITLITLFGAICGLPGVGAGYICSQVLGMCFALLNRRSGVQAVEGPLHAHTP